jgi:bifunctional non-homologous end joining protein LigD
MPEAATRAHCSQRTGLKPFLKTSKTLRDWDTVKDFSKPIVVHLAGTVPQRFVAKSGPSNRRGKIFID